MISLERKIEGIPASLSKTKRRNLELDLLRGHRSGVHQFSSSKWSAAKKALKRESFGKCAYCESPTDTVAHGDVEHFRPKSIYWWMAYWYANYSYSCQICNQTYKSDKFPIAGTMVRAPAVDANSTDAELEQLAGRLNPEPTNATDPAWIEFTDATKREKAGIPDPYDRSNDPEDLFAYVVDETLQEVSIVARTQSASARRAIEAAEECLGLNREELRRVRFERYEELATLKDALLDGGLATTTQERTKRVLRRRMQSSAPWAGMARYFLRDEWQVPL